MPPPGAPGVVGGARRPAGAAERWRHPGGLCGPHRDPGSPIPSAPLRRSRESPGALWQAMVRGHGGQGRAARRQTQAWPALALSANPGVEPLASEQALLGGQSARQPPRLPPS